jgi:hypothetical protein
MQNSRNILDRVHDEIHGLVHVFHFDIQHFHEDILHFYQCLCHLPDEVLETILHRKFIVLLHA